MESKERIKLGVAVCLLGAAVILYFVLASGDQSLADADDPKTAWHCTACDTPFELSGRQMETMVTRKLADEAQAQDDAQSGPVPRGQGSQRMIKVARCPACNAWSGVAARRCGECGTIFKAHTEDHQTAICPKCDWNPVTGRKGRE